MISTAWDCSLLWEGNISGWVFEQEGAKEKKVGGRGGSGNELELHKGRPGIS